MSQKIDDLIARGNLLGENWWAADADDIGTFSAAAADAREDIKAMHEENKRLRQSLSMIRLYSENAIYYGFDCDSIQRIYKEVIQALGDKRDE